MIDYQLADPGQVRAVYDDRAPFEGRDMLLWIRFAGVRFGVGVRIGAAYEWTRDVDGRPARVYGWYYDTLEGHFEQGRMHYEVWKWLDSGEVQFRLHAISRGARDRSVGPAHRLPRRGQGQPAAVLSPRLPAGAAVHRSPARGRARVARAERPGPLAALTRCQRPVCDLTGCAREPAIRKFGFPSSHRVRLMADHRSGRLDLAGLLAAVEDAPPVAAVDVLGERLRGAIGAFDVSFLIADFSGQALIRLDHGAGEAGARTQGRETAERVPLVGTPHGRALAGQTVEVEVEDGDDGARLYAPVTNRGEAIGVLELGLADAPDEQTLGDVALAAHALAYVVIANRRFTDLFAWGQRSVRLSLAAEIQHRLLPSSYTCEAGQFTLAAWLEPAGNVGGDTFDFSMDRDTLHLSMTDAMGHEVGAAVLATVLVGALRNARRAGAGLGDQAGLANAGLADFARRGGFVTGQVARIDRGTRSRPSSTRVIRLRCGCATAE